jgi:hypothetical protein
MRRSVIGLKMVKLEDEIKIDVEKFHYLYTSPNVTNCCSQIQVCNRNGRYKIYIQNFNRNICRKIFLWLCMGVKLDL